MPKAFLGIIKKATKTADPALVVLARNVVLLFVKWSDVASFVYIRVLTAIGRYRALRSECDAAPENKVLGAIAPAALPGSSGRKRSCR